MRQGKLIEDGEHVTLVFERTLHHTPEHVWDAIATPDGLAAWALASDVKIDGRTGGTIEMVSGPPRYHSTGKVLRWDPPRVFEYEWNVGPVPEMPDGQRAIFCYELSPIEGGTQLTVTYRRITKAVATGFLPGTHVFLDRLEAQLDGLPQTDWHAAFEAVRRDYPNWTPHAPHAGQ